MFTSPFYNRKKPELNNYPFEADFERREPPRKTAGKSIFFAPIKKKRAKGQKFRYSQAMATDRCFSHVRQPIELLVMLDHINHYHYRYHYNRYNRYHSHYRYPRPIEN